MNLLSRASFFKLHPLFLNPIKVALYYGIMVMLVCTSLWNSHSLDKADTDPQQAHRSFSTRISHALDMYFACYKTNQEAREFNPWEQFSRGRKRSRLFKLFKPSEGGWSLAAHGDKHLINKGLWTSRSSRPCLTFFCFRSHPINFQDWFQVDRKSKKLTSHIKCRRKVPRFHHIHLLFDRIFPIWMKELELVGGERCQGKRGRKGV